MSLSSSSSMMSSNSFVPFLTAIITIFSLTPASSIATTLPSDVAALAAFKSAIAPSTINPWSCLASWNFTSDPCRPSVPSHFTCGITCSDSPSSSARITAISLDPAGYSGTLSPAVSSLTSLSHLELYDNNFYGPIPSALSLLPSLTTLVLSSNSFSGPVPASLSQLSNLQTLDLSRNSLTGPVPALALPSLRSLDLSFNRLSGALPDSLPPNLVELSLRGNSLSGSLKRSTFQSLKFLEVAELAANRLGGKLEGWFFLLPSLQQVDLANNTISAIDVWKPTTSVGTGERLVAVDLSFNRIEGELPAELAVFPSLAAVSARHNRLRGQIPLAYGKFRRLFLDGNFLNGEVPDGLLKGDVTGSCGDNCLAKCPRSASLCSPVQKPGWVCKQVYGVGDGRRKPSPRSPAGKN